MYRLARKRRDRPFIIALAGYNQLLVANVWISPYCWFVSLVYLMISVENGWCITPYQPLLESPFTNL